MASPKLGSPNHDVSSYALSRITTAGAANGSVAVLNIVSMVDKNESNVSPPSGNSSREGLFRGSAGREGR